MTRATRAAALALIATVGAWPALDEKLRSYPSIHARETAKIKAGDAKGARYILFDAFHGLGNREQVKQHLKFGVVLLLVVAVFGPLERSVQIREDER